MSIYGRVLAVALSTVAVQAPKTAAAWDSQGHMMVAFIAYQQLTPATRARVDALIALNPEFKTWKTLIPSSVPSADRPAMLFMIAATWPDRIKGDPSFHDDGTHSGNRPDGPPSAQNMGYTDCLRHRYWHFVDTPFSTDGTTLPPIPVPNAQERIHLFREVLASTTETDKLKSYDLVWLLHLVGDVHQPLHDSTRVQAAQPDGDDGGNLVKVCAVHLCSAGGTPSKLHAFWDDVLGTSELVTKAADDAKLLASAPPADVAILDEGSWVQEGLTLAQSQVYQTPIGAGDGPFSLTAAYRNAARALARSQIALAGARLANVLNAELK